MDIIGAIKKIKEDCCNCSQFPAKENKQMCDDSCMYGENQCPYQMAISALEKQIPIKPIYSDYSDDGDGKEIPFKAYCPICGNEFEFGKWNNDENHHCICGQAILWRKAEKNGKINEKN